MASDHISLCHVNGFCMYENQVNEAQSIHAHGFQILYIYIYILYFPSNIFIFDS